MSDARGGLYRGTVVRNDDPDKRLRIQVRIPQIHGGAKDAESPPVPDALLPWAEPAFPFGGLSDQGHVMLPAVGATVWLGFELGFFERPVYIGAWYGRGETPTEVLDPDKDRIIKTPSGHLLHFRDSDQGSNGKIHIKHEDGDREIILDGDLESLTIKNKTGQTVVLDGANDSIKIEQTAAGDVEVVNGGGAQRIKLDGAGQKVTVEKGDQTIEQDAILQKTTIANGLLQSAVLDEILGTLSLLNGPTQSAILNMLSGNIDLLTGATALQMTLAGTVDVTAATSIRLLTPGTVDLGSSAVSGVVLEAFKTLFNSHVHPTTPAISGPPTASMVAGVDYSTTVKAQP